MSMERYINREIMTDLLKVAGKSKKDLASYMGVSTTWLTNKFNRDSFSIADLLKAVAFVGGNVTVTVGDKKIVLSD